MNKDQKDINKQQTVTNTGFGKSIMKKQFRFSDWFAEKFIKSVAFFSIAFVVLIFLFVFRETLPLFKAENKIQINDPDQIKVGGALKPDSYTSDNNTEDKTVLKPESYSPDTGTNVQNHLKPESYGNAAGDTTSSGTNKVTKNYNLIESQSLGAQDEKAVNTLFSKEWQPVSENPRYGMLPLILGTLKVTIIAILFAAPLAILAALYTAMFAPSRLREYIKPVIELLAGFPSVVIGFFALMILASFFQNIFGYSSRLNAFVGGIAMSLSAIPVIYTLTEDALTAVPRTYIEASLGLGASIRQTAFSVVMPAATPGIFAAVLLGIGRVFGETMIALMATGNAALVSANTFDSVRTLSATIGAEMAEVVFGDTHYSVLFLIGSLLFIFTFLLNAAAEFYFKNRLVRRIQGQ